MSRIPSPSIDQLASARGRIKNARNQLGTLRYVLNHHLIPAYVDKCTDEEHNKAMESVVYIGDELNAALEAIESVENADDDGPLADYYVLTPDCATLDDAHPFVSESFAELVASTQPRPAKVVHRPNRP